MRRVRWTSRLTIAGATMLLGGASILTGTLMEGGQGPAFADSSPVELFCPGTPIGNVVFNDTVVTGSLSPSAPSAGEQFSLDDFQAQVPVPAAVVQAAAAIGNTSLSGTVQSTIEVTGATPATMASGALSFDTPIPDPVPASGVTLDVPASPDTFGPFTASSPNITVALSQEVSLTFLDAGTDLDLTCSWYPNDSLAQSGTTQQTPPGLPIGPVLAYAGNGGPGTQPVSATGPYELYCPRTPVGSIALNDVVTSGTISPGDLAAGDQFDLGGYQTQIPIPPGIASGLAGFGNSQLQGYSSTTIDAFGASPSELSTGLESFDVSLPSPIPATGVTLDVPSATSTIGPFTANGGQIVAAGQQTTLMVTAISSHIVNISCEAYPNDTVTPSGVVTTEPLGSPILPVIATGTATGSSTTTTSPPPPSPLTGPYELYCPGTPLGNVVLNDTETSAAITPSDPSLGGTFDVTDYQTQITVPQALLQLFEDVGVNSVSGYMEPDISATGALPTNNELISEVSSSSSTSGTGSSSAPTTEPQTDQPEQIFSPYPVPGFVTFDVSLPTPVPPSGVTFDVPSSPGDLGLTFTAIGGPIVVEQQVLLLDLQAGGTTNYSLFCQAYPNNTEPEGVTTTPPQISSYPVQIATGTATVTPPGPPYGSPGPFEEYCPGTPIGDVVLNNVTVSGSLSPANPSSGEQFDLTGFQESVPLPATIASAAQALEPTLTGSVTSTLAAVGATPSTLPTGNLDFDITLPDPVPSSGVDLAAPTSPTELGPFTSTGGTVTILAAPTTTLTLDIAGTSLSIDCFSYTNNSAPSGISATGAPAGSSIWPVVATNGPTTPPPAGPSISVSPSTGLSAGESVSVTGSGFSPDTIGAVLECNIAPDEPTVSLSVPLSTSIPPVPVGCSPPSESQLVSTSSTGTVSTSFTVTQGTVGPPCGPGDVASCPTTDSAGNSPAADAADYPCPPTPAQQSAGATCELVYGDQLGETAASDITFAGTTDTGGNPTGTDGNPTGTDGTTTTTTTQPASTGPVTITITVSLPGGIDITITIQIPEQGSGDPTVETSSNGTVTTDSTNQSTTTTTTTTAPGGGSDPSATSTTSTTSTTDPGDPAANTSGGSSGGSSSGSSEGPSSRSGGGDPSGAGSSGDPVSVAVSSGSLAFTGTGAAMGWLTLVGAVMALLGVGLLVLVDMPRRMSRIVLRRGRWLTRRR